MSITLTRKIKTTSSLHQICAKHSISTFLLSVMAMVKMEGRARCLSNLNLQIISKNSFLKVKLRQRPKSSWNLIQKKKMRITTSSFNSKKKKLYLTRFTTLLLKQNSNKKWIRCSMSNYLAPLRHLAFLVAISYSQRALEIQDAFWYHLRIKIKSQGLRVWPQITSLMIQKKSWEFRTEEEKFYKHKTGEEDSVDLKEFGSKM